MPRTLNDVILSLPKRERMKIEARTRELVAEEMSLQALRKAVGKTQTAIAKRLRVGQDAISKLETRADMYVSTLRNVIEAMGGDLDLIARFPDRPSVRLGALGAMLPRHKSETRLAGRGAISTSKVADVIARGVVRLQSELINNSAFFPYNEIAEGWFQYGLVRVLNDAGYKSYPEYPLVHLSPDYGAQKADIAIFESDENDYKRPSILIEVKAARSTPISFKKDANRLAKAARMEVAGILVYVSAAIAGAGKKTEEDDFAKYCLPDEAELAISSTVRVKQHWHTFKEVRSSIRDGEGNQVDLNGSYWGVLIATYAALQRAKNRKVSTR
ncbi:MAG TPA: hypothetical protein VMF53_02070 [Alphaproteobacteria bacterium]|nr:hypothetical protein [Alphaproteobacteria bacterium]